MKKAGIIGDSAIIGSYIVLKFLAEEYKVKIQVNRKYGLNNLPLFRALSKNQHLEIHETNLASPDQIQKFINDCELIIHCGESVLLDIGPSENPVYATITKGTGAFIKSLRKCTSLKKVIFITSAVAFNTGHFTSFNAEKTNAAPSKSRHAANAQFHASKAINKIIDSFPDNLFEVIFISPVEIRDHQLISSAGSTASGFKFLFGKEFPSDPFFQKILSRQVISGLTNIEELPEKVFSVAEAGFRNEAVQIKDGQLPAHRQSLNK